MGTSLSFAFNLSSSITAALPPQCSSYVLNTDSTRNVGYTGSSTCDSGAFGAGTWVRFDIPAGTYIITYVPSTSTCGTDATGWYTGVYPSGPGLTTSGSVCYNWSGSSCMWANSISITHCGSYYVFYLINSPNCNLRYCTA